MKSSMFEYSYQPRIKHRGKVFKQEDLQEPDMLTHGADCGLLLLLEACQQLDGYPAKYGFYPPVAQTLLRRAGTGRRKPRSFFKTELFADAVDEEMSAEPQTDIVVHDIQAQEEKTDTTVIPTNNAGLGPKRKGRKELHGPCSHCGARCSPQWRKGPKCKPVLCNACGIRFLRTRSLGKVSRGRKRKPRSRDADDAGDDSDNSDFLDVPDPKRQHRLKSEVQNIRTTKMARSSRPLFAAAIIGSELPLHLAPLEDSETTSSTSTAEPRLDTNHQLFCTAHSLHGKTGTTARNPFLAEKTAFPSKLGMNASPSRSPAAAHLQRQGPVLDLATAASSSPVLTVAPLVLTLPTAGGINMTGEEISQSGMIAPTWIRRKPSSGPSRALFKKSMDL